jgi:hypothetical protein
MPDKQEIRERISEYRKSGNLLTAGLIVLALLLLSAPFVVDTVFVQKSTSDLDASVEAIEPDNTTDVGASVDSGESLEFGRIENGVVNVTKSFTVSMRGNQPDRYFLTRVDSEGNISKFLKYEEEHTFRGSKDIQVEMVSNGTGNFSGVVHVKVQAANNDLGEQWLKLKSRLW